MGSNPLEESILFGLIAIVLFIASIINYVSHNQSRLVIYSLVYLIGCLVNFGHFYYIHEFHTEPTQEEFEAQKKE